MKPKIDMITIPVENLKVSEEFYRNMLEVTDDQISAGDDHIAFFLGGEISFVLFERSAFAQLTTQRRQSLHSSTVVLTHTAESIEEVNEILLRAEHAGGMIMKEGVFDEWSYTGYFKDPNGHVWEVMVWNKKQ